MLTCSVPLANDSCLKLHDVVHIGGWALPVRVSWALFCGRQLQQRPPQKQPLTLICEWLQSILYGVRPRNHTPPTHQPSELNNVSSIESTALRSQVNLNSSDVNVSAETALDRLRALIARYIYLAKCWGRRRHAKVEFFARHADTTTTHINVSALPKVALY